MPVSSRRRAEKYSFADYITWDDDERWEIIDGTAYAMTPAPQPEHQEYLTALASELFQFFRNRSCKVYVAPFDVRLAKNAKSDRQVFNVVQPDISVVCNEKLIDRHGCKGAPDLVVEILSPSTASRDHIVKKALYEQHGVKEYWLVDLVHRLVTIYRITVEGRFELVRVCGAEDIIETPLFPELQIDLGRIFPKQPAVVCQNPPPRYKGRKETR